MNHQDHAELERLKRRQEALQMQLANLTVDIQQLASRLNATAQPEPEIQPLEVSPFESASPAPAIPPPLPPIISSVVAKRAEAAAHVEQTTMPPAIPAASVVAAAPAEPFAAQAQITRDATIAPETITPASVPPPIPTEAPASVSSETVVPGRRETFEMKLGTYWLVRVGIVMLLTGLVFLGTYAYKNFIGKLGPGGKVALLYAASAGLLGFGGWLQRKREKESLRNYGQVLFAGGLAAVYFTTYAAHYLPTLRVIASPVVDALLLMGWAAITIWIADRRKSEVLALFAVSLAYYTSSSAHVGLIHLTPSNLHLSHFTLTSNLVLTAAAVFFLVRNRWTTLSFISLLATYGGFAFWRFYNGDWSWDARTTGIWSGNFFLAGYWLFFTAAAFLSRGSALVNVNRSLFASLNNGAFFGLVLLSMMHQSHGHFWIFSLAFGSVLLGASFLARIILPKEPFVKNTYLVQGLVLVTLGFIAHYVGVKLALILAAESVVLTILGGQQKNLFVRVGGYLTAALSLAWLISLPAWTRNETLIGSAIGAAFLVNAWWENRQDTERGESVFRPFSGYFVALAVAVCGIVTWHAVPQDWRAVVWLTEAVAFTILFYALRIPELPILSQALALAAQAYWCLQFTFRAGQPQWIPPATFIGSALALNLLGHRQKNAAVRASAYLTAAISALWTLIRMSDSHVDVALGVIMSAAFLFNAWWESRNDEQRASSVVRPFSSYFIALMIAVCGIITWRAVPEPWRAVAWMIEAVGFTALFYAVRISELPIFSQGLALVAQGFWFFQFALQRNKPHWAVPAILVAGTLALSHWWQRQRRLALLSDLRNVLQIIYALALVGVLFFWFKPSYGPAAWLAFLCLLAIGLTVYGVMTRAWALAACAQLFLLISSFELCQQFLGNKPGGSFALVPIATWLVLGVVTTAWLSRHDTRESVRRPLLQLSAFYRAVAFLMSLWWIYAYVPARNYFWVLCALSIGLTALAGWLKNREALIFSGTSFLVAYLAWFIQLAVERHVPLEQSIVNFPNALALLSVLAIQQGVRRRPQRFQLPRHVDTAVILLTGVALWTFVSRWVVVKSGTHFLLTVSWAALAAGLFMMGFMLRERMHRWLGLSILACAVGRVFLSDVWKLETIYRILSFMALGVVLLALGFIYNKYQEKIRQWL